jgi:FkbM family methyltransferase
MISADEFQRHAAPEEAGADIWARKAAQGRRHRERLMSFGRHSYALLVEARHGLFAVDPEDGAVSRSLLDTGEYGEAELALASGLLTSDSRVLLVGAHIGAIAVPLSRCCAYMEAVEANPATQRLFEANLRLNGCDNVKLHKIAASDRREMIPFLCSRENSGGSKRRPINTERRYIYDDPEEVLVEAIPLDELCGERAFDLIFMDIEGSETFALRGMQKILSSSAALCVEFLPHHLRNVAGVGVDDFADQIEPHFDWLYVPARNRLFTSAAMGAELHAMYDRNEQSDGLYFLKSLPELWLRRIGLSRPNRDRPDAS